MHARSRNYFSPVSSGNNSGSGLFSSNGASNANRSTSAWILRLAMSDVREPIDKHTRSGIIRP